MARINITWLDNISVPTDIIEGVVTTTEGKFAYLIMGLTSLLLFRYLDNYPFDLRLIYISLVMSIISVLLYLKEWIAFDYIMLPVLVFFSSIIYAVISRN